MNVWYIYFIFVYEPTQLRKYQSMFDPRFSSIRDAFWQHCKGADHIYTLHAQSKQAGRRRKTKIKMKRKKWKKTKKFVRCLGFEPE